MTSGNTHSLPAANYPQHAAPHGQAASQGDGETVEFLLLHNADLSVTSKTGETPFDVADASVRNLVRPVQVRD